MTCKRTGAGSKSKSQAARSGVFPSRRRTCFPLHRKNAPLLEPWQREVVRIVRKVANISSPTQTQVMNEGWATSGITPCSTPCTTKGLLTDSFMMEFLHGPTPTWSPAHYNTLVPGINPYALGFCMWRTSAASAKPHRRRPPVVPRHRRKRLAEPSTVMRNFRTKALSPSSCRPRSCATSACSPFR